MNQHNQSADGWTWEVADFRAIPDEYKTVSPAALRQAMNRRGPDGTPEPVPGIRFTKNGAIPNTK